MRARFPCGHSMVRPHSPQGKDRQRVVPHKFGEALPADADMFRMAWRRQHGAEHCKIRFERQSATQLGSVVAGRADDLQWRT